jgi:glycerol dehydrogenase
MLMRMLSVFSSPSRYSQGPGATDSLGQEMARLGLPGPVLIVAGRSAKKLLSASWAASLPDASYAYTVHDFGGECSHAEIGRIVNTARRSAAATLVGSGGGKVLDAVRAAAAELNLPVVNCPTLASSDAPCSALSVIYTEEGVFQEYRFYRKNPDLVLVDTAVIAQAPPRLLAAGMGDALATWFEAKTCVAGHVKNMRGGASTRSALALAELCYKTLIEDGADALRAVRQQAVTPALERIVEANTLLSGLGFESSGLAAAHAIHNGLTAAPPTHHYFHGEKVAFGTLVQLVLDGSRSSHHAAGDWMRGDAGRLIATGCQPLRGSGRNNSQRAVRGHITHGCGRHSCRRRNWPRLARLRGAPMAVRTQR